MNPEKAPIGNILIVDDTAENLRLLAGMLAAAGYEVRPVTNGRQALQAAAHSAPDLVLLDINMPGMDGYEVCRRLKEIPLVRDVPVIFLTALTDTSDKLKGFGVGGVDYIAKPFQIEEVQARVNVHISLRRTQQELARNFERLRDLEKLRDDLVHMIVHDMRSPLMVIMGHLDLLKAMLEERVSPDVASSLAEAASGIRRLTVMANDLLDVSKMEEGRLTLNCQTCDLLALAREVATEISTLDRSREIIVVAGAPAWVSCDVGIMRRTLQNLLDNAIKHTPSGSAVRVSVIESGNQVRLSVIDRGPGVPVESREKIFDRFGSVQTRADMQYHSVGLGLAFCKLAAQAHAGTIGVDKADGVGSVFWVQLARL